MFSSDIKLIPRDEMVVAMARTRRFAAAVMAVALGIVAFAAPSTADPYANAAAISVSDQTPAVGGTFVLTGTGFCANEDVNNVLQPGAYPLASAHTDSSGAFSVTVQLPAGVSGVHTIVSTCVTTGRTASTTITIGGSSTGGGGGGGLASTGVAVIGIGALGLILLVGGGLMLLAGKRRSKVNA